MKPDYFAHLATVGFGAALFLAGCAVGPNYHPPKTEVSSGFSNGNQTNINAGQPAITWWHGFNDELLNQLIVRALETNQDLRIATARVRQARALRTRAIADVLPVVNGTAAYTKSATSTASSPFPLTRQQRELELYTAGFDATWELDIFGGGRRSIEAASADVTATQANRQDVFVSLIAEVARNYCELRGEQNLLAVAQRNVTNQRETMELTVSKFRAGRATELDTARARTQLQTTLAAIPPIEANIKHSIYRLSVLTGQQPVVLEPELSPPVAIPTLPALVEIGNPAELIRRRADIRAAERSVAAATARIGVAVADLFPHVFFNGNAGFAANQLTGLGKGGTDAYSFGPQITWAALDIGHVRARIEAANAQADVQLASYEKTVLLALEETENALVDFGREQVRRDYLRDSVRSASEARALALQRYEGGVSDFLPVLDSERTELDVQAQLADSEMRTATSLIAVYKALGGGWEIEQPTKVAQK